MVRGFQPATLCHPLRDGEVLLIRKLRGAGAGYLVGPGGKVESDETPREAAIRETREETGLCVRQPEKVGELRFRLGGEPFTFVHVYVADAFAGEPRETAEGVPGWYDVDDLPFEEMWAGDRHWLPLALGREPFEGTFRFDADGDALRSYDLDRVPGF